MSKEHFFKDFSLDRLFFICYQVDRSAAYAARWVAKSLVKAGLVKRCLVQVETIPIKDFSEHGAVVHPS
jgi:hypothetical protein